MDLDSDNESNNSDISDTQENNAIEEDVTEQERLSIREKISNLNFEDLIKMKEQIGSKQYNETVFGTITKKKQKKDFKRANKNRPREMSSKLRFKKTQVNIIAPIKNVVARDPRFDPLCGTFDDKSFKSNYKFLNEVRLKEKKQLEKEFKESTDPERKTTIKFLIQRMDNQIREQEKRDKEEYKKYEENKEIKDKLKKGEKPVFKKKSVKRLESLIEKYETLKKTNKLQKHIEKKTKQMTSKERKSMKSGVAI